LLHGTNHLVNFALANKYKQLTIHIMKKVYVTAVSVFMAACAAASLPMSKHIPEYPVDAASQKSDASAALLMKSRRSVQRSGSSEKATRNDLLGTFVWDHYRFMNPGGWQYMFCFPEIVAGEKDDEVIIEADRRMSVEAVCEQMGRTPPWAEGLVLRADGFLAI